MLCIDKTASALRRRKRTAAGEIPDTVYACIAVIHSSRCRKNSFSGRAGKLIRTAESGKAAVERNTPADKPLCCS